MKLTWTADGERFRHQTGTIICEVTPSQPATGARIGLAEQASTSLARCFALPELQPSPLVGDDSYVRLNDLSLRYAPTKEIPTSVSVVWRLHDPLEWLSGSSPQDLAQTLLLESIISFQTDLLDAAPLRNLESVFPAATLLSLPPLRPARPGEIDWPSSVNAHLFSNAGWLLLSAVYPSDLRWLSVSRSGEEYHQQARLRAESLEKGVIRRLRCLLALGPESLRSQLETLPDQFADSKLPLSV